MEMIEIKMVIGIIGKICSGKSTIAKKISERYKIPIVSFGKYLLEYSKANSLPTSRDDLQNLGEKFIKTDVSQFLQSVLVSNGAIPNIIIIEGVRHLAIAEELTAISSNVVFIFTDASVETRFERYNARNKEIDSAISFSRFIEIQSHTVESEIDTLKNLCSFHFCPEVQEDKIYEFLNANGVRL